MKYFLLICCFLALQHIEVCGQTFKEIVFLEKCDSYPQPNSGEIELKKYIESKYSLSINALSRMLKGDVSVLFLVNKDGVISDFSIQDDLGFGTGEELLEVLKKYAVKNKWIPGIKDGNKVDVRTKIVLNIEPSHPVGYFKTQVVLQVVDKPNSKKFKKATCNYNYKQYIKSLVRTIDYVDKEAVIKFDIDENGNMVNVEKISSGHFVNALFEKIVEKNKNISWKPAKVGKTKIKSFYLINVNFLGLININHPLTK